MLVRFQHLFGWLTGAFRSPADLILENRALRQQLLALHAQRPLPRLRSLDRLFCVTLQRLWSYIPPNGPAAIWVLRAQKKRLRMYKSGSRK